MVLANVRLKLVREHQAALRACGRCGGMTGPAVVCTPVVSPILLVGQAPGDREPLLGRPFAWTAGKQLFRWLATIGADESSFRDRVYMAAVCRCFPGKNPGGGDRVPNPDEIRACRPWLERELELLKPELLLPIGRLAIEQFLPPRPLVDQVGKLHRIELAGRGIDVIPLPHPSGASTWPRREPGKALTATALSLLGQHPAFRALFPQPAGLSAAFAASPHALR
jgi:uracil-DNA glycosylase